MCVTKCRRLERSSKRWAQIDRRSVYGPGKPKRGFGNGPSHSGSRARKLPGTGSAKLLPVPWQAAIIAMATSVIVGVIFGTVPANRAAGLDPVETLKYE